MGEKKEKMADAGDIFSSWMKISANSMNFMTKFMEVVNPISDFKGADDSDGRTYKDYWQDGIKTFQKLTGTNQSIGTLEDLLSAFQMAPDITLRLIKSNLEGFSHFHNCWGRIDKLGKSSEPFNFKDLEETFLKRWPEIYEKEFRKFFNIPQLGLMRFYEEKFNQSIDRYNTFQASMSEYFQLLVVPFQKSLEVFQEKVAEMLEAGNMPEDSKTYYDLWIKIIEGHCMKLFQSREYVKTMNKALSALNEFLGSRQAVIEDLLKLFPVPTHKDMDAMALEIYHLKKKLRNVEGQLAKIKKPKK